MKKLPNTAMIATTATIAKIAKTAKTAIIATTAKTAMIATIAIATMLLAGCHTDELCYDHPHEGEMTVNFDMTGVPDGHCTTMRVWLYPVESSHPTPYDLPRTGGTVYVYNTEYRVLAHNNDTEWITFTGQDGYDTHHASTRDADILEPMNNGMQRAITTYGNEMYPAPGERVAVAPEPIYGAGISSITPTPGQTITLKMEPRHCTYTFEFKETGSLRNVAKMSAAISGMAESASLSTGDLSTNTVTIPLSVQPGSDDNSITGSFYTYGHNEDVDTPHRMALYIIMKSGKQYRYVTDNNLDVTSQIHSAPDKRNVHIVVTGIKIPSDDETGISDSGGWDVSLGGWDDEDINIGL